MSLYAMLSVDLTADSSAREKFNESMKSRQWTKVTSVTTVWTASFKDGVNVSGAVKTSKNDVAASAKAAGIVSYEGVVQVGNNVATRI